MSKIDELIKSISNPNNSGWGADQEFSENDIVNIMKEYAEWYARKCLTIAKRNVRIIEESYEPKNKSFKEDSECDIFYTFDEYSLNIELPKHD